MLKAIRAFEKDNIDWQLTDLSKAVGISSQHAHNIVVRLTFHGVLHHAEVIVKKRRLVLADGGFSIAQQSA